MKTFHDVKLLNCQDCGKQFNRSDNLERHRKFTHICGECNKEFCSSRTLSAHITKDHGRYECEQCEKVFSKKSNMSEHLISQVKCVVCEGTLCSKNKLKVHMLTKHSQKVTFSCSDCGKNFSRKWLLERHRKKMFETVCDQCEDQFCNLRSLTIHKNRIHEANLEMNQD